MKIEVVFCDFVRMEANGKHLLVGVYPSDILTVAQLPGPITLSAWMKIHNLPVGRHDFEMTFYSSHAPSVPAASFKSQIDVLFAGVPTTFVSSPVSIFVSSVGQINVWLRITDTLNREVCNENAGRITVVRQAH